MFVPPCVGYHAIIVISAAAAVVHAHVAIHPRSCKAQRGAQWDSSTQVEGQNGINSASPQDSEPCAPPKLFLPPTLFTCNISSVTILLFSSHTSLVSVFHT
ncbi:hypothetical protein C8Q74DRAFT_559003 [Fomes fomentarius]|nr:hypothetical protein C8Q74DRAFT_559003 [Fomes fomentarius]